MFSAFNTIVLKPLPYADREALDRIDRATPQNPEGRISPADFLDVQKEAHPYEQLAAYGLGNVSLAEPGRPSEMARSIRGSVNLFSLLRMRPQLGRDFLPGEDVPGNDRVVIISQRCWKNRFGGTADIIGRSVRVDGVPHTIVGVLPLAFNDWRHLGFVDVFRPLALDPREAADRHSTFLRLIGRRAPGVGAAEAEGFVAAFGARLAAEHPAIHAGSAWRTISLAETVMREGRTMMAMCIGLSGFVLLIACSNLANLLLARTMARAREFAVRSALGASRRQLLTPLIAESLILALAGGACAILVAQWMGDWLAVRSTGDNGEQVVLFFDWRVFGWAFVASLATAIAFGLAPALFALRLNLNDTLKSGGRGATEGRGHRRFRHLLIVGQFALAMVLLAGAALFIRGLDELNHRRAGWDSERLVTGTIALPSGRYPDAERMRHSMNWQGNDCNPCRRGIGQHLVVHAVLQLAGRAPLPGRGRELPEAGHEPAATVNCVTPRYFETFGTRVLAGGLSTSGTARRPRGST
jgi:predicted permease